MTDQLIVELLIAKDERTTKEFFFKSCRPLFLSIIRQVFSYEVDYDEFVNEFYIYLMENDAYRLKQFQGRSTIYQWIKITAIRYFISKRDNMIDSTPKNSLSENKSEDESIDTENRISARMDIARLLSLMPNKRYAYVIKRLQIDEATPQTVAKELRTNVNNLYNIKKRAIAALTEIADKEIEKYEKENNR